MPRQVHLFSAPCGTKEAAAPQTWPREGRATDACQARAVAGRIPTGGHLADWGPDGARNPARAPSMRPHASTPPGRRLRPVPRAPVPRAEGIAPPQRGDLRYRAPLHGDSRRPLLLPLGAAGAHVLAFFGYGMPLRTQWVRASRRLRRAMDRVVII